MTDDSLAQFVEHHLRPAYVAPMDRVSDIFVRPLVRYVDGHFVVTARIGGELVTRPLTWRERIEWRLFAKVPRP